MKKITNLFIVTILFISVLSCDERIIPKPVDGFGSNTGITPVDPPTNTPKTAAELILGDWVTEEVSLSIDAKSVIIYTKGKANDKSKDVIAKSYSFSKGGILDSFDKDDKKKSGKWALSNQDKKVVFDFGLSSTMYDIIQVTDKNFDFNQTIDLNLANLAELDFVKKASDFGLDTNKGSILKVTYKMSKK